MTRRPEDRAVPRLRRTPDELVVDDTSWINLGQLRALVRAADERAWADNSLVSTGAGGEHPYRHDLRTTRRVVIEGSDPVPTPDDTAPRTRRHER